jgi:hypothetical protein
MTSILHTLMPREGARAIESERQRAHTALKRKVDLPIVEIKSLVRRHPKRMCAGGALAGAVTASLVSLLVRPSRLPLASSLRTFGSIALSRALVAATKSTWR